MVVADQVPLSPSYPLDAPVTSGFLNTADLTGRFFTASDPAYMFEVSLAGQCRMNGRAYVSPTNRFRSVQIAVSTRLAVAIAPSVIPTSGRRLPVARRSAMTFSAH